MHVDHVDPAIIEPVRLLAAAADAHGDYFPGHSHGVAYIVRLMALEAGLAALEVSLLELAAMLHDVGKLLVPAHALGETGPLNATQWELIRQHPGISARFAESIGSDAAVIAPWVRHHHERIDGTGYPSGLPGAAIPLQSRMLFVADAFHVMTAGRAYSPTRSRSAAILELEACADTQFDRQAVAMLTEARPALPPPTPPA